MKKIYDENKPLKVLELFGGIGAPRKALENLGLNIKSIDYVEILPYAVVAYNQLFDNNYKPQNVLDWNLKVDLLIHGSPCQDFSNAGKNDLKSGRSILYERTLEIIKNELNPRPKYVLWENVKGLLSKKHIKHFNHYLNAMEKMGYYNHFEILNSLDFGIPQRRERVFVVSIRSDINQYFDFDNLEKKKYKHIKYYLEKEVEERYTIKAPSMLSKINNSKAYGGGLKVIKDYITTITTKQDRSPNSGIVDLGNGKYRLLTERECWRLMGFEDSDFDKILQKNIPSTRLYELAGNSIVVDVLEAIFKELLF